MQDKDMVTTAIVYRVLAGNRIGSSIGSIVDKHKLVTLKGHSEVYRFNIYKITSLILLSTK